MVYSYKLYQYKVPAEVVGEEFEKIEKQYGKLTNELVLQSAESEDSPLHEIFEWDDAVAGHKWRLEQATKLIVNLTVEVESNNKPKAVRAYLNVSEDDRRGTFINVNSAFNNPDTREIVLKRALNELEMFKKKYSELSELSMVFAQIDLLLDKEVV